MAENKVLVERIDNERLNQLLQEKKLKELKEILSNYNPIDIKDYMEELDIRDSIVIFRLLSKDDAIDVFSNLETEDQYKLLRGMSDIEIETVVNELYFDDMIDLLEEMPAGVVKKLLRFSTPEERGLINQFLKYPKDSAGSLMTIEYVELREYHTAGHALDIIKRSGSDKVTIYTCYVTDEKKRLLGFVTLRNIVTAQLDCKIRDLMDEDVIFVHTDDDQETVANVFSRYGFVALPVVDSEKRITGIITVDDIMEVMEQEATEDFQKMAAMSPDETEYLDTKITKLAKNRVTWLLILMISATFTGSIMNKYNQVIQSMIVLNMFVPMIMDTGGNSGSQSSTLIIRGLATGEIQTTDIFKVIRKEFGVSIIVGLIMAMVNMAKCLLFDHVGWRVAMLVSITLIFTITTAKLIGGILPIIAKKLKLDPAIMAGPLITTIVDALSLIIYFELTKVFL